MTINHDVKRGSNLDLLLRGFIGAVNRFADMVGGGLQAIALAVSTTSDNSEQVAVQIAKLEASRKTLDEAIKSNLKES